MAPQAKQERDPVCGMMVDVSDTAISAEHDGKRYYFCSSSCKEEFQRDPRRYAPESGSSETFTKAGGMVAPKFGSAGSGGAEYEPGPERPK